MNKTKPKYEIKLKSGYSDIWLITIEKNGYDEYDTWDDIVFEGTLPECQAYISLSENENVVIVK